MYIYIYIYIYIYVFIYLDVYIYIYIYIYVFIYLDVYMHLYNTFIHRSYAFSPTDNILYVEGYVCMYKDISIYSCIYRSISMYVSSVVDVLITHPNIMNDMIYVHLYMHIYINYNNIFIGAMLSRPTDNILYVEGYALDEFSAGHIGIEMRLYTCLSLCI
jgi:hypothetical protein